MKTITIKDGVQRVFVPVKSVGSDVNLLIGINKGATPPEDNQETFELESVAHAEFKKNEQFSIVMTIDTAILLKKVLNNMNLPPRK